MSEWGTPDRRGPSTYSSGSEAPEGPDIAEIEAKLDEVVPGIVARIDGKDMIPGWHLLRQAKFDTLHIGNANIPYLPEEHASILVTLAETNPHAFDLASYIAGMNVIALKAWGVDLCPSLSTFAARALIGEVSRPPQLGRPRAQNVLLRVWQYGLCRFVEATTPLNLTRNDERGRQKTLEMFTACHAVARAFSRAGIHTTYPQMKSLCFDEAYKDTRELAEYLGVREGLA